MLQNTLKDIRVPATKCDGPLFAGLWVYALSTTISIANDPE